MFGCMQIGDVEVERYFVDAFFMCTVLYRHSTHGTYHLRELNIRYSTALFPLRKFFKCICFASGADMQALFTTDVACNTGSPFYLTAGLRACRRDK